jgi:hypothetical protein
MTQETTPVVNPNTVSFSFRTLTDYAKRKAAALTSNLPVPIEKKKTVEIVCPLLTLDDVVDILNAGEAGKMTPEQELLIDTLNTVVTDAVRAKLTAQPDTEEANVGIIQLDECTFSYVANQPKATRSRALSDEAWAGFADIYLAVMPEVVGKRQEVIQNHVNLFKDGMKQIGKDFGKLNSLKASFDAFTSEATYVSGNEAVVNYVSGRFTTLLKAFEKAELEV